MKINIDNLTSEELIDLNNRIIERLKFLDQMDAHNEMMKFSIGEKVSFFPSGCGEQIGTVVKYNKKSISIVTEKGERWNVSPHLLSKQKYHKNNIIVGIIGSAFEM